MTLPQGALEQLLSPDGGVEAFDKAVADSQVQTQALLNREPVVAKNNYSETQKDVKSETATKDAAKSKEPPKGEKGAAAADTPWDFESMSDDEVIRLAAIDAGKIPSNFEWDRPALAKYGKFVLHENIAPTVANELASWWVDVCSETIGDDNVDFDTLEARLNEHFATKLSAKQRADLSAWMRRLLAGGGEGEQA